MNRPWNKGTETSDESPWEEYGRFEDWIKSLLPDDESREYYDDAPTGFSSYLYAGLAGAFDTANACVTIFKSFIELLKYVSTRLFCNSPVTVWRKDKGWTASQAGQSAAETRMTAQRQDLTLRNMDLEPTFGLRGLPSTQNGIYPTLSRESIFFICRTLRMRGWMPRKGTHEKRNKDGRGRQYLSILWFETPS